MIDGGGNALGEVVLSLDGGEDIARDDLCALVGKLVERVLAVRSWLAPEDGPRLVVDAVAAAGDVLAIRLHVALLEISCKAAHVCRTGG